MRSSSPPRIPYLLVALFVVLAVAIAAVAYRFHIEQKDTVERDVRNQLLTIADIKVKELSEWRTMQLGEAHAILADRMALTLLRRVLAGEASASERAAASAWMDALSKNLRYADVLLLDPRGKPALAIGQRFGSAEHLRRLAAGALRNGAAMLRDFLRDSPSDRVHIGLNLPLRLAPGSAAFGVLAFGIDPETYLYPLLETWPVASTTGESVLVRRDGDDALFLSRLRSRKDSAVNFRVPLSRTNVLAVQAVNGKEGNIEALDAEGVPLVAAVRRVPDSPWYLIAKMEKGEVEAPIRRHSLMLGLGAVLLILAGGAVIVVWWRHEQFQFYRERYQAEIQHRVIEDRAAQALQESESRFRAIFEQAAVGMADASLDARFIRLNQRFCEIMGYPREELLDLTFRDITHPDDLAQDENLVAQLLSGKLSHFTVEKRYLRKDGGVVWANLMLSLHSSPSGDPLHFVAVVEDITGQKQAEEDRRNLEGQLLQAQKMESVGRLAGGVAHDFNNHLTVINGYCAMLLDDMDPDDPLRESVDEILLAGNRAATLTQQLLTFSRKQVAEPRVISLNDVVAEARKMLSRVIGEDIQIIAHFDPDLGSVVIDPSQMNQVLVNMAINARDAMPDGGRITIETSNIDLDEGYAAHHAGMKPGPYVLLTVTDTGVGMTQQVMQHIFEPFYTTKRMGVGTGLGLSTVYGIVAQAGGWIWVYSEPGRGSTFKVYLPRVGGAPTPLRAPVAAAETLRGTETVLVVEDQPEVRRLTLAMLESQGYQLLEAGNGIEALALCQRYPGPIHLLITDVVMPGMTGRELARLLSALRPSLRTLYTSGYAANTIAHEGVLDPGVAYLPKPFSPSQLAAKVRDVLLEPTPGD